MSKIKKFADIKNLVVKLDTIMVQNKEKENTSARATATYSSMEYLQKPEN